MATPWYMLPKENDYTNYGYNMNYLPTSGNSSNMNMSNSIKSDKSTFCIGIPVVPGPRVDPVMAAGIIYFLCRTDISPSDCRLLVSAMTTTDYGSRAAALAKGSDRLLLLLQKAVSAGSLHDRDPETVSAIAELTEILREAAKEINATPHPLVLLNREWQPHEDNILLYFAQQGRDKSLYPDMPPLHWNVDDEFIYNGSNYSCTSQGNTPGRLYAPASISPLSPISPLLSSPSISPSPSPSPSPTPFPVSHTPPNTSSHHQHLHHFHHSQQQHLPQHSHLSSPSPSLSPSPSPSPPPHPPTTSNAPQTTLPIHIPRQLSLNAADDMTGLRSFSNYDVMYLNCPNDSAATTTNPLLNLSNDITNTTLNSINTTSAAHHLSTVPRNLTNDTHNLSSVPHKISSGSLDISNDASYLSRIAMNDRKEEKMDGKEQSEDNAFHEYKSNNIIKKGPCYFNVRNTYLSNENKKGLNVDEEDESEVEENLSQVEERGGGEEKRGEESEERREERKKEEKVEDGVSPVKKKIRINSNEETKGEQATSSLYSQIVKVENLERDMNESISPISSLPTYLYSLPANNHQASYYNTINNHPIPHSVPSLPLTTPSIPHVTHSSLEEGKVMPSCAYNSHNVSTRHCHTTTSHCSSASSSTSRGERRGEEGRGERREEERGERELRNESYLSPPSTDANTPNTYLANAASYLSNNASTGHTYLSNNTTTYTNYNLTTNPLLNSSNGTHHLSSAPLNLSNCNANVPYIPGNGTYLSNAPHNLSGGTLNLTNGTHKTNNVTGMISSDHNNSVPYNNGHSYLSNDNSNTIINLSNDNASAINNDSNNNNDIHNSDTSSSSSSSTTTSSSNSNGHLNLSSNTLNLSNNTTGVLVTTTSSTSSAAMNGNNSVVGASSSSGISGSNNIEVWLMKLRRLFDWLEVLRRIPWRTKKDILHRFEYLRRKQVLPELRARRGTERPWSEEENNFLVSCYMKVGSSWARISKELYFHFGIMRDSRRIREHYIEHLNPNRNKNTWNHALDSQLLSLHNVLGNRWVEIGRQLNNISGHAVKNRYYQLVKNKTHISPHNTIRGTNNVLPNDPLGPTNTHSLVNPPPPYPTDSSQPHQ